MKVHQQSSQDSKPKDKGQQIENGSADSSEDEDDLSPKRSRSRSKSPRNVNFNNGELMFDAAMYAPERPKRNRVKRTDDNFASISLDDFPLRPVKTQKRKAPEKVNQQKKKASTDAKSSDTCTSAKKSKRVVKEEEEDGPPKAKKKCVKKVTQDTDSSLSEDAKSPSKSAKDKNDKTQDKPQEKTKKKSVKKSVEKSESTAKDSKPTVKKSAKKQTKKSETVTKPTDGDANGEENNGKTPPVKKPASKKSGSKSKPSPSKKSDKAVKSTPNSERASKSKKSPAKIEIDGIEITELSDLNSSREDDFSSSRESLNNISNNENETSVETVLYESNRSDGADDQSGLEEKTSPEKGNNKQQSSNVNEELATQNGLLPIHQSTPVSQFHKSPKSDTVGPLQICNVLSPDASAQSKNNPLLSPTCSEGSGALLSPSSRDMVLNSGDSLSGITNVTYNLSGDKKMLPCPRPGCKYEGKSGVLLRKHMRNHGIFECAHCDFVEKQFELLEAHMKEKHPTRWGRKKCKKCNRHIRTDLHEEHEKDCDGTKIWKCDECGHEFPFESTMKEHKKKHRRAKQHECDKCDFKCETKANLKSHMDSHHERSKDFECQTCKKTFFTAQHLQSHEQSHLNGDHPCNECSKSFKTEQSLINHKYIHQKDSKCVCDVEGCEMTFKTPRLLNYHRKEVHKIGLSKLFKCEYDGCTMEFPRKSQLKKHVGMHTGERRFSCDWEGCHKTFRHNANLKIHYMQHTGEKPIKCEHCDFACRQRSSILFHMKTKHPGLPIPRTDRGRSPRREGSTTPRHQAEAAVCAQKILGSSSKLDTSTEDTQDYPFNATSSPPATKSASSSIAVASSSVPSQNDVKPVKSVDPNVYDFPDDDEEEGVSLPLKKPPALKSPIRSLSEMESKLESKFMDDMDHTGDYMKNHSSEVGKSEVDATPGDDAKNEESEVKDEASEEKEKSDDHDKLDDQQQEEQQLQSIPSETASQHTESSKFSDIAQEHVSENFPMNSSEGTTPTDPSEEQNNVAEHLVNPIEGALGNADDLDEHIKAGDESDVIDEKMLRSPMSTISEDMRALNMPNVSMINESDLQISPSKKGEDDDVHVPHKLDDMPPEIDANEVDALLESGILDGHHNKAKEEELPDEPDVPSDYNEVMAKEPGSNLSSHPETPSSHYPQPASFPGYPPSCGGGEQHPNSNQQLTPERDRPPPSYEASTYPIPDYPPLSSASQSTGPPSLPPNAPVTTDSSPIYSQQPSYPVSQSPSGGMHYSPPSVTSNNRSSFPPATSVTSYPPVSSAASYPPTTSIASYPPATTVPSYQPSTPTTSISSFPSLPSVTSSFLDNALSGRSSLDPLTSMARSTDMFGGTATTASTTTTSSSSYTSSTYPSTRDLFGHYFPSAADPSSLPLSHLPPPPTQDQRSLTSAYSQSPSSFQALQRTSADLLQRASSGLPGMNYPSVTESLARLNPSLGAEAQQSSPSWPTMPGHDDRSRAWPNPSLMPDLHSATRPLSRNPFPASRPDYNFDAAAAATKRPDASFPGVPQSVANPTDRYDVASAYMGASHFNAAAAAASSNYARTMTPGLNTHMPDHYRALSQAPPPAAMADMYGRMGMNPALGLDKYYPYSRDAMYRSQHSLVSTANPFMPQTTAAQMSSYGERDYARNPMYSQESAYGKYLPSTANIAQSMPTLPERPADYFQARTGAATADPYMHDPYRRSVIHNMINRYF